MVDMSRTTVTRSTGSAWLVVAICAGVVILMCLVMVLLHRSYRAPLQSVTIAASPVEDRVAFSGRGRRSQGVFVVDFSTGEVSQVTDNTAYETVCGWSPDGRRLIVSRQQLDRQAGHLVLCDLASGAESILTDTPGVYDLAACWSADLDLISFSRAARRRRYSMGGWTWDNYDVWVMQPDGSGLRQLTHEKYYGLGRPAVTRDGKVVYGVDENRVKGLFEVDLRAPGPPRKIASLSRIHSPALSPTADKLAVISDETRPFRYEVWRLRTDGSHATQVSTAEDYGTCPCWTHEGKRILFVTEHTGYRLWSIKADGTDQRQIAGPELFNDPLQWTPDDP